MREGTFYSEFSEAGINAINGIGSIHHAAYTTALTEKRLQVHPISLLYDANGSRVMLLRLLESAKFGNSCLEVYGIIDFLKLGSIFLCNHWTGYT